MPELTEAAKEFDALVAELNEKKRTSETHQKVLELMSSVDGLDKARALFLCSSGPPL